MIDHFEPFPQMLSEWHTLLKPQNQCGRLYEALIIHRILGSYSTDPWWLKWLMRNALYWHFLPYSVSPFWIAYSSVYILNKCILKGWGPEIFRFQSLLNIGVTASTLSIEHFQPIHPKSERLQITIFLDQQI